MNEDDDPFENGRFCLIVGMLLFSASIGIGLVSPAAADVPTLAVTMQACAQQAEARGETDRAAIYARAAAVEAGNRMIPQREHEPTRITCQGLLGQASGISRRPAPRDNCPYSVVRPGDVERAIECSYPGG